MGLGGHTARSNTYVLAAKESRKVSFWLPPLGEENLKLEIFPNLRIVHKRCHQKHKKLYVKLPNSARMSLLPLTHTHPPPPYPSSSFGVIPVFSQDCVSTAMMVCGCH